MSKLLTLTLEQHETINQLFPEPLNEQFYLWAHHYEECDENQWSHPGILPEDDPLLEETGCYTTAQAVAQSREVDAMYLARLKNMGAETLWDMAAYYQWLCAHGTGADGTGISVRQDDVLAWAEGKLPEMPATDEPEVAK